MREDLESRLEDLGRTLGADESMVPRVMGRIDGTLRGRPAETERTKHGFSVRRLVMGRIGKLAAAAVIVIGVIVGYEAFKRTGGVSWAQVRQQVAAVRAVVYKADITGSERGQAFQLRIEGIQADDYGTRTDTYMGDELMSQSFALSGEKSFVTLLPGQKKYSVVALTEAIRRQNGDPKAMVEAFLGSDYKSLGRREIDGVAVEGVESRDVSSSAGFPGGGGFIGYAGESQMPGEAVGRLWVDVATGWPVEVTLDVTDEQDNVQITMVVREFQWNAQVEADAFAAVIPEGYELLYKIDVGRLESGEQLVEGLAYFAEFSGGRYPAKLTVRDILSEVGAIYQRLTAGGATAVQVDDDQIVNLKLGANYLGRLGAESKEPVYYGATVTPADAGRVLLRWKLDDGQYRVIYGNLRIEDVSPQRLAELEAQ
jgi:hypothetical protein